MRKRQGPKELAIDLLPRSPCGEKVAAVLVDKKGLIFGWGWNHPVSGKNHDIGKHAEAHAVERANPKRLKGATIYVAGCRESNGVILNARPCDGHRTYRTRNTDSCLEMLKKRGIVRVVHTCRSPDSSKITWTSFDI